MARRMSELEFIEKARSVHGDKYEYERSGYKTNRKPVTITCREHGDFQQDPSSHIQGSGCMSCCGLKKRTNEEFIDLSESMNPGKYEYNKTKYVNSATKVTITCKRHGDFIISPKHIVKGYGCRYCSGKKINTESFIERASLKHDNRYSYSKSKCLSVADFVIVTCHDHGEFSVNAASHLKGVMCKKCQTYGFKRNYPAKIYCLLSDCGSMIKIGITSDIERRHSLLRLYTPFGFSLLASREMTGESAFILEKGIKKEFQSAGLSGFNGCTEWLVYDERIIENVKNLLATH